MPSSRSVRTGDAWTSPEAALPAAPRPDAAPLPGAAPLQDAAPRPDAAPLQGNAHPGSGTLYERIHRSADFGTLRSRRRRFIVPATAFFLGWYFLYVLCAAFAPGFMSRRVYRWIDVGLVFGLLQFVTTFALTMVYAWWAGRRFDPLADGLREEWERQRRTRDAPT